MDDFCCIRCFVRLTTIHIENKFIIKAFREEIRMNYHQVVSFQPLEVISFECIILLASFLSCILFQIVYRKHQLLLKCCGECRPTSGTLFRSSTQIGLFLFQFSAHTFKQTPKRTNMVDTISPFLQINLLNFILRWQ